MQKTLLRSALLLIIFNCSFIITKAQWVSIPDSNFGSWLNAGNYSNCMQGNSTVGWQMDTTCNAVISATVLYYASLNNIQSIEGVQYFDNLSVLYCGNNQLTSLPALPGGLTELICEINHLTSLPALPGSLTKLYCAQNQLTSLPALPGSLSELHCYLNALTSLPPLPGSLIRLECYNNALTTLPPLPGNLTELYCSRNQLTSLPALPGSLNLLSCEYNQLTSLPTLPGSLTNLSCSSNLFSNLPALPNSLEALGCASNQLTSLPLLPNSLNHLYCQYNQLSSLPELPDSLNGLGCSNNPYLLCLPQLKKIVNFNFDSTGITCLPNYPQSTIGSNPALDNIPLCDSANNINGCLIINSIPEPITTTPQFSISPNPASSSATISADETLLGSNLTITDITGRQVTAVNLTTQYLLLNTAHFAQGLYFVTLETKTGRATKKLVKQ